MNKSYLRRLLIGLAGLLFSMTIAAKAFNNSGAFYLQYFGGSVDPSVIPQVYNIFDKLRNVADKHANRWPELLVIRDLPGHQALALPDGHIVLSYSVLTMVYKGVDQKHGDARMAFILGHELAHLAEDDFWDKEMIKALTGMPEQKQLLSLVGLAKNSHTKTRKETQADDKGLLYAALAGYPVAELFEEKLQGDFLSNWVTMTGNKSKGIHAPVSARAKVLKQRLKQRALIIEEFRFAVRLASFGRCADALQMLENLQTFFPGRSLFNNIAYCRLQQALQVMPRSVVDLYWLPNMLDVQSRIPVISALDSQITLRGSKYSALAEQYLIKASKALQAATQMDPYYVSAWINLASVELLRGEVYQARAAIEAAYKLAADDMDVKSLRLLILYEEGLELDVGLKVIELMKSLIEKHPDHVMTQYNLARILSHRGRLSAAKIYWRNVARADALPLHIRSSVCQLLEANERYCGVDKNKKKIPWQIPVIVGADLLSNDNVLKQLPEMKKHDFQLTGVAESEGSVFYNEEVAVLSLDNIVEMVVLKQIPNQSPDKLLSEIGVPNIKTRITDGEIWHYGGWSVLVQNHKITEIWVNQEQ